MSSVRTDGNGNFLVGKRNFYLSIGLVIVLVGAAGYTTKRATEMQGAVDLAANNSSKALLAIDELKDEGQDRSDSIWQLRSDIRNIKYRLCALEQSCSPNGGRVGMNPREHPAGGG